MGKNEIRLRRQRLTSRNTDRFRNYGAVLKKHEAEMKVKKIIRVFSLFLIIMILALIFVIVQRWEKRSHIKKNSSSYMFIPKKM